MFISLFALHKGSVRGRGDCSCHVFILCNMSTNKFFKKNVTVSKTIKTLIKFEIIDFFSFLLKSPNTTFLTNYNRIKVFINNMGTFHTLRHHKKLKKKKK